MMSIYPGVSQTYIPCRSVHLRNPCLCVCKYIERLRQYMPYDDVANLVNVTKTNMINETPCVSGTLTTTPMRV